VPAALNPTAASLLGFLHSGEATGDELVSTAETLIGEFWHLTRSQVYRELTTLAAHGLIEAGETGPRSRRPYRLTEAGREEFIVWLAVAPGAEQIRYPLLLTLAFGAHIDRDQLGQYLESHRSAHEQRLREYLKLDETPGLDCYQQATLRFGIQYERAVLTWMDELPALLSSQQSQDFPTAAEMGRGIDPTG
jgi:DNA-binding PadR family transcriptional regulator